MMSWMGVTANPDSAMYGQEFALGTTLRNQTERAARYARDVQGMVEARMDDGSHAVIGMLWWEYMDKWGERANWGLVSPRHNAYDGKQEGRAPGKDAWGVATGGEDADYGDFLSGVTRTNRSVVDRLRAEFSRASGMSAR